MAVTLASAPLAAALAVAACGGTREYSFEATRACLEDAEGVNIAGEERASEDALARVSAIVDGNLVHIGIARDEAAAKEIERTDRQFRDATGGLGSGVLYRDRNAVLSWTQEPTDAQRERAEECLRD